MPIPSSAARFPNSMDSQEVLEWVIPFAGKLLETGEEIDPADGRWSLTVLPEGAALGLEMIEGDPVWPDPELVLDNTAIRFWAQIDPAFYGNAAFQGGVSLPLEATIWTTANPPRKRQRTLLLTVVEQ